MTEPLDNQTELSLATIGDASYHLFGGLPHPGRAKKVLDLPGGQCVMMIGLREALNRQPSVQAVVRERDGSRVIEVHALDVPCGRYCYSWRLTYALHLNDPVVVVSMFGASPEHDRRQEVLPHHLAREYMAIANTLRSVAYNGGAYDVQNVIEGLANPISSRFPTVDFGLLDLLDGKGRHAFRHPAVQQYVGKIREAS